MADILLPIQSEAGNIEYRTSTSGTDPLTTSDTFQFHNSGRERILLKKGTGGANVVVETHVVADGNVLPDKTIALTANRDRLSQYFEPNIYNDDDGKVGFTLSAVTNLSIAIVRL